jgi:hypothetical protein
MYNPLNQYKRHFMAQACPINFSVVDNTISRINSLQTAVVVMLFVLTANPLWLYLLGIDLMIRLHGNQRFSPIYQLSRLVKTLFSLPSQKVDGASKKVAGHFGLLFIVMLVTTSHAGFSVGANMIASIYVLCLLMDVVMNFCVGCKVYHLYRFLARAG